MAGECCFIIKKHFYSREETDDFAYLFTSILKEGDLLLFTGKIGTGKTAFIKAMAKALGVTETVTSPSFVLHSVYESGKIRLSHVDLYRLYDDTDVEEIGFEDFMDTSITAVEWADRYAHFEPPFVTLNFIYGEQDEERILEITSCGGEWKERLEVLK